MAVIRRAWIGCSLLAAVWVPSGCDSQQLPPPVVSSIEPATVSSIGRTPAVITGDRFYLEVIDDLSAPETVGICDQYEVHIDDVALAEPEVTRNDRTRLDIILPAGLKAGTHDVTVVDPLGRSATLEDGLTVTDDAVGLRLTIEDAPTGSGGPVGARSVPIGESLTLFAVLRDGLGTAHDAEALWSVDATAGTVQPGPASSTTFIAQSLGDATVRTEVAGTSPASAGPFHVTIGSTVSLHIEDAPDGLGTEVGDLPDLTTDDEVLLFAVGRDADNNFSENVVAHWTVNGPVGAVDPIDSTSTTIELTKPGTGWVRASHESLPRDDTGTLTVGPGRAAVLVIEPNTLSLTTDDSPVPFQVTATDNDGNQTTDVGTLTWSVATGTLETLDPVTGILDPTAPGTGTIGVTSTYPGLSDESGVITIVAGRATTITVAPDTLEIYLGDPPVAFTVTGTDSYGNPTSDLGTITWSVASGSIGNIHTVTGVLTPTLVGTGTIRADGFPGVFDETSTIRVLSPTTVTVVTLPAQVVPGQSTIRVEVEVDNGTAAPLALVAAWLDFEQGGSDLNPDYVVIAYDQNPILVPAGGLETLVFWVDVDLVATLGTVDLFARVETFATDLSRLVGAASWDVIAGSPPDAVITKPVIPDNRICAGDTVDFDGSTSTGAGALTFDWAFDGGSPATASIDKPAGIIYAQVGTFPYWLMVTDSTGAQDTVLGPEPIFVGEVMALGDDQYPTGTLTLQDPFPGQQIDMDKLPDSSYVNQTGGAGYDVDQCDGSDMADGGASRYLTIFIDRGVLARPDPFPAVPGLQALLDQGAGHFGNMELDNTVPRFEGSGMVYLEYLKEPEGVVTAAGWVGFEMTNDLEPPWVLASLPVGDCGTPCLGKTHAWRFLTSERLDPASVANTLVEVATVGDCSTGVFVDVTAGSSITHDAMSRVLTVLPEVQAQSAYAVRVTLGSGVTDASSNANPIVSFVRCAMVDDWPAAPAPAVPSNVNVAPDPFSPDGDTLEEITAFQLDVDAAANWIWIAITRGRSDVITLAQPVIAAGTQTVTWDGRDWTGRVVPDGFYAYHLFVDNAAGASSTEVIGVIQVDSAIHFVGVPPRF